ncbi:hypothetical protein [Paenibacillus sp. NPDC057934]|uniref:hypothetical protein n=1 Tax=Paenibacillus sp. NPDC057934 TaxID=3346282 RepID=UPI0036D86438
MSYRLKIKPLALAALLVAAVVVPLLVHADKEVTNEASEFTKNTAEGKVKHTSFSPSILTSSPGTISGISTGTGYLLSKVSPWSKIVAKAKQFLGLTSVPAFLKVKSVPLNLIPTSKADYEKKKGSQNPKENTQLKAEIVKGRFKAQPGL